VVVPLVVEPLVRVPPVEDLQVKVPLAVVPLVVEPLVRVPPVEVPLVAEPQAV
jgi:hypothetical protein